MREETSASERACSFISHVGRRSTGGVAQNQNARGERSLFFALARVTGGPCNSHLGAPLGISRLKTGLNLARDRKPKRVPHLLRTNNRGLATETETWGRGPRHLDGMPGPADQVILIGAFSSCGSFSLDPGPDLVQYRATSTFTHASMLCWLVGLARFHVS